MTATGVITVGVLNAFTIVVALSIVDVVAQTQKPHDAVSAGWGAMATPPCTLSEAASGIVV